MIFQNNRDPLKEKHTRGQIHFKSSSGGGDNYDAAYNARMATLAESQQEMANKVFDFYEAEYQPMESEQIAANRAMIPYETALNKEKIQAERDLLPSQVELGKATSEAALDLLPGETALAGENTQAQRDILPGQTALTIGQNEAALSLLPGQTDLTKAKISDEMTAMKEFAPVRTAYFNSAKDGVDIDSRVKRAAADAAHSFMNSDGVMRRNAARMGINPNSGRFTAMTNTNSLNRAKTIAGAKTQARTQAEQENFGRLTSAMNFGAV